MTEISVCLWISVIFDQGRKNGTINRLLGLNNGQISGLIGASVDYSKEDNEIEYWVGTEYKGNIPDGLSSYQISAEKWAIFEAVGPVADVVPKTWKKYIQSGFRLIHMNMVTHRLWKYIKALTQRAP
ncbi:hypothetical protein PACILC2_27700 [Paenibacillus cisolokensis]|uniref:Integron-associated effector binding protein domain-containing protein n=1 Tax=Paenibacillus cisolokensis TaxID=1658519 RepID=A0ABQ4N7K9_9BACL|nr:hypothetical protein PACILC2_27700 [Paenibacillus cisolokensis]